MRGTLTRVPQRGRAWRARATRASEDRFRGYAVATTAQEPPVLPHGGAIQRPIRAVERQAIFTHARTYWKAKAARTELQRRYVIRAHRFGSRSAARDEVRRARVDVVPGAIRAAPDEHGAARRRRRTQSPSNEECRSTRDRDGNEEREQRRREHRRLALRCVGHASAL